LKPNIIDLPVVDLPTDLPQRVLKCVVQAAEFPLDSGDVWIKRENVRNSVLVRHIFAHLWCEDESPPRFLDCQHHSDHRIANARLPISKPLGLSKRTALRAVFLDAVEIDLGPGMQRNPPLPGRIERLGR
jgi:hypothetical protein